MNISTKVLIFFWEIVRTIRWGGVGWGGALRDRYTIILMGVWGMKGGGLSLSPFFKTFRRILFRGVEKIEFRGLLCYRLYL